MSRLARAQRQACRALGAACGARFVGAGEAAKNGAREGRNTEELACGLLGRWRPPLGRLQQPATQHLSHLLCRDRHMAAADDIPYVTGKGGEQRMKSRTITIPVITGTCAFYLGKKVGCDCD